MRNRFFFQKQFDTIDCGPSCLRMIAGYYGRKYPLEYLREQCYLSREGVSMLSINDAAEHIGLRPFMAFLDTAMLCREAPLPCILHWDQNHFVVLYRIKRSLFGRRRKKFVLADPAHGIVTVDEATFNKGWISTGDGKGAALFMETTAEFYSKEEVSDKHKGYRFLFKYIRPYRKHIFQVMFGMLVGSCITLVFPILAQILIDNGVMEKNLPLVLLILVSQLMLFLGNTVIGMIRSWLILHVNIKISLSIISDFLMKLLRLPIRYFDTKAVGDLSQRINDHHRIESFLTGDSLTTLFSVINIIVFTSILALYDWRILLIFLLMSGAGITWILLFQKRRKRLDYRRFARNKENQDRLFEMITGMQEIKLFGSETAKRWEWERLQVKIFKLNMKGLALEQYQQTGYVFFTQLKNILASFLAAQAAINGHITLGGLVSISYIIGQTNGPIDQLVSFFKSAQDAKLSMDRLQEIHNKKNEETQGPALYSGSYHQDIVLDGISFRYEGLNSPLVLDDVSFTIPAGKITAIVGSSGSGKTTLMKLLLNFYPPTSGAIHIGNMDLRAMSPKSWRTCCGTVMQDGYIFSDTIARNIALDGKPIDGDKMENAVSIAHLEEFLDKLPLRYTTRIGNSGVGISGGQRQRILIARAIYKDPQFLFFDEATSSLDANNERIIMDNLEEFFQGRTVVIIAHRLSTVKHADQIIVLDNGRIAEIGDHGSLVRSKGKYFGLVKNQLELGN